MFSGILFAVAAWGVVVAAGRGERLGRDEAVPKAFRPVAGLPMVAWSLRAFAAAPSIARVVVVVPASANAPDLGGHGADVVVVAGGDTRQASVRAGLAAVPDDVPSLVVHDAARPLVSPQLVEETLAALGGADAAVCAVPLADTLKRTTGFLVAETVPREGLWRAQTPQAFSTRALRAAHELAVRRGVEATDDAALVELSGGTVVVVQGDERNLKVTTKADLDVADALLRGRA